MAWLVIWVIFLLVVGLPGGCLFQRLSGDLTRRAQRRGRRGELDLGGCLAQIPQQRLCDVAVLDAGGSDQHGQQQSDRVDGDVPLSAVDLLPAS